MRCSNRDLRDALPDRGLSISEHDLRLAIRKEEERMAGDAKKPNRSFSFSTNLKELFRIHSLNSAESVSSKNVRALFLGLKAFSKSPDSSRLLASKSKQTVKENALSGRESRASLPSICITAPVSDIDHSPRLSTKLGSSISTNVQALGGNENVANNLSPLGQTIKTSGQEDNQCPTVGGIPNAFDESITKHQKWDENKQQEQKAGSEKVCYYNEESVHHGHNEREQESKTEKHGIDKAETEKEGLDNRVLCKEEQENSHSTAIICRGTDADNYFAVCTYQASGDGELTVYEGDKVEVLTKAPNGWWMVCIDDDVGWVPSNFLVDEGGQEDEANQDSLELADDEDYGRLSSDDYDGDDDEQEQEDADEYGIDDGVGEDFLNMVSGVNEGEVFIENL